MQSRAESILLAGIVTGIVVSLLELVPVLAGCLVCMAYVGSGFLAVWHYTRTYGDAIRTGPGAFTGSFAAMLAAIVSTVVDYGLSLLGTKPSVADQIRQGVEALEAGGLGPEQIEGLRDAVTSPLFIVAAGLVALAVVALLGAAGGAMGASAFGSASRPQE